MSKRLVATMSNVVTYSSPVLNNMFRYTDLPSLRVLVSSLTHKEESKIHQHTTGRVVTCLKYINYCRQRRLEHEAHH